MVVMPPQAKNPPDFWRAEFETDRTRARLFAEESERNLETYANRNGTLMVLSGEWNRVGICSAHLGDRDNTQFGFRRYLKWYHQWVVEYGVDDRHGGSLINGLLQNAILVRDAEVEAYARSLEVPQKDKSLGHVWAPYLRSLKALSAGDRITGRREADAMHEKAFACKNRYREHLCAVGAALAALSDGDRDLFQKEMEALLLQHRRFSKGRGSKAGGYTGLMCFDALYLAALGERYGIHCSIDDQLKIMPMRWFTSLEEWEGKPIPRQVIRFETNIFPVEMFL